MENVKPRLKKCLIRGNGNFRIRWDLMIIFLVLYNCIQIPLGIAWEERFESFGLEVFGYIVDIAFLTDLILNFRTTFIN